ncbi:hypothetical protein [Pseudoxanthomonas mexicana]
MNGREGQSLRYPTLLALLLGACAKTPESPVAKTNPNPTQRYEITVELIDPPRDIQKITGVAKFGVGTRACLPYREKIARVTIGASYQKEFPLVRVSDNTYKGHIFLDWPIDEDYYGLGVCEWRIGTVDAVFTRDRELTQSALLIGSEVTHEADTLSYCRRNMRGDQDRFCSIPIDPARVIDLGKSSYQVEMSSRKY